MREATEAVVDAARAECLTHPDDCDCALCGALAELDATEPRATLGELGPVQP